MKIPTPILTLIVGAALAASLLISSMSAVSAKKAALAQESANAAATSAAATSAAAQSTATASATVSPAASATTSGFVIPPHANYDGEVQGDLGAVAVAVHDTFAVAYFCNGSTQEAWFKGTPHDGNLSMTGAGNNKLVMTYALGHARGTVTVDGVSHVFSIIAVHKPSGLFESIAVVRGATVKAGWIVLPNGTTQIGSLNPNMNAANSVSQAAPKLNLSTLTASDDGVTLVATPIDAETGSGF